MKIIFICYNYLTLYKAIYNIRNIYSKCECIIIYRTSVSEIPTLLSRHFNVVKINFDRNAIHGPFSIYADVFKWVMLINSTAKAIKKEIEKDTPTKLVVFKDSYKIESTLIEKFKKYTQHSGKVVLIEEGLGIYEKIFPRQKAVFRMNIVQKIFRLSKWSLNNYSQGYNPLVDEIVCSDIEKFKRIKGRAGLNISEQKRIFSSDNARFFIINILGYEMHRFDKYKGFKCVYLTQPMQEIGLTENVEEQIINRIYSALGTKVLIKKHPRDMDKRRYVDNHTICEFEDELNDIPFECIYGIMNDPIIITFYSSVYVNILEDNPNAKVLLLYKLLKDTAINTLMDSLEQERDERIIVPDSIDKLGIAISNV